MNAFGGTFGDIPSMQVFLDSVKTPGFKAAVDAARKTYADNNTKSTWALAETNVGQLSFYLQDEIQASKNFTLTLGLRFDKALYFNTDSLIAENLRRNCCYDPTIEYYDETGKAIKFSHTDLPESNILISPRIGFNWDVKGDRTTQLRGGTGLFTGRFPFVWIGNQVANPNFFFYNTTRSDFKFPQVWRTNLGFDQKFGEGWTFSTDLIYTKDVNAMMVRNYGVKLPTAKLQGVDN
ncbi:MAG: TonB-dependent receptor, partial [Saprospiraceae bacterium]|nr:TonB-dependent receptor [Saprospiraceae bacterium]